MQIYQVEYFRLLTSLIGYVSKPSFKPVIDWKFKFVEISLGTSKGLNYFVIDVDDLSCNLPSITKTAFLAGKYLQTSKHQEYLLDNFC